MAMELPDAGKQTSNDHMQISRRFIEQTRIELADGDRLQAAEKVWGAAAHALKAIAIDRGWQHSRQEQLTQIAIQLGNEFDRPDIGDNALLAENLHTNFYSYRHEADTINRAIDRVEQFAADLTAVRASPPRPFQVRTNSDRNRLQRILGRSIGENESSEDGFVNHDYLERLRQRRER